MSFRLIRAGVSTTYWPIDMDQFDDSVGAIDLGRCSRLSEEESSSHPTHIQQQTSFQSSLSSFPRVALEKPSQATFVKHPSVDVSLTVDSFPALQSSASVVIALYSGPSLPGCAPGAPLARPKLLKATVAWELVFLWDRHHFPPTFWFTRLSATPHLTAIVAMNEDYPASPRNSYPPEKSLVDQEHPDDSDDAVNVAEVTYALPWTTWVVVFACAMWNLSISCTQVKSLARITASA